MLVQALRDEVRTNEEAEADSGLVEAALDINVYHINKYCISFIVEIGVWGHGWQKRIKFPLRMGWMDRMVKGKYKGRNSKRICISSGAIVF